MTTHHILDYRVIVRQINTDFFGNATPDQPHFESAVKELLNKGYVPQDELKTTSGSAGGFFSSSQYPTMAQAFVLYGTAEEKEAWDKEVAEKAEAAKVQREKELEKQREADRKYGPIKLALACVWLVVILWIISEI